MARADAAGRAGTAVGKNGREVPNHNPAGAQRFMAVADIVALFVSFTALFHGALRVFSEEAALLGAGFVAAELTAVSVMVLRWIRIYDLSFLANAYRGTIAAVAIVSIAGGGVLMMFDATLLRLPDGALGTWLLVITGYFAASRLIAGLWFEPMATAGAFRKRIAIVGGGSAAAQAIKALEASPDIDVEIIGLFDDRDDERAGCDSTVHRKKGSIDDLEQLEEAHGLDLAILAIPMTAHGRVMQLLPALWRLKADVRISAQAIDMKLSPGAYTFLGRLPLLNVFSRQSTGKGRLVKGLIDRLLALALIASLSPVLLVAGLAVTLSGRGPLLVKVARAGFDGNPFHVWRFRTRHPATDQLTGPGAVLQKLGLDELPELFNVLTGSLAMVGPTIRVSQAGGDVGQYETVAAAYCARLNMKPGLTGWAQIHGFDGQENTPERIQNRVQLDLDYADRAGLMFDLRVLAKSPFASLRNNRPASSGAAKPNL